MKNLNYSLTVLTTSVLISVVCFGQNSGTGLQNQAPTQSSTAAPANANPPTKAKKPLPQAKTQEEYGAYQAATGLTDIAAARAAADDFTAKFPQSELRTVLYSQLLQKYDSANQPDNVISTGRKILAIEPENTLALIMVSTALAQSTRESDLDRDQKYTEAIKEAQTAIQTIDTGLVSPPTLTPEQLASAKKQLISMANSSLGFVEMNRKNFGLSEQYFKEAINNQTQPDAVNYLRLALAQDDQKKYNEALKNVSKAIQIAESQNNQEIAGIAKNEKDRLTKLASSAPAAKHATPAPQTR